jgi:hypothetical protein
VIGRCPDMDTADGLARSGDPHDGAGITRGELLGVAHHKFGTVQLAGDASAFERAVGASGDAGPLRGTPDCEGSPLP